MQTTSNSIKRHPSGSRGLLGAALVGAALAGSALVAVLRRVVLDALATARAGAPLGPDEALAAVVSAVALLLLGWLALAVALEVLALAPGTVGALAGRVARALSPLVVRRAVTLALGLGLGSGAAGAAHAHPPTPPVSATVSVTPSAAEPAGPSVDPGWTFHGPTPPGPSGPGWTPEPPTVRPQPDLAPLGARRAGGTPDELVVHRGDTLWDIAARHLGPGASDVEVAQAWPQWFAANRHVIGDDPDLLLPGQVLRVPEAAGS